MKKADHLFYRVQALAAERPYFFEIKGPSVGNHDTAAFMKELRSHAEHHLLAYQIIYPFPHVIMRWVLLGFSISVALLYIFGVLLSFDERVAKLRV